MNVPIIVEDYSSHPQETGKRTIDVRQYQSARAGVGPVAHHIPVLSTAVRPRNGTSALFDELHHPSLCGRHRATSRLSTLGPSQRIIPARLPDLFCHPSIGTSQPDISRGICMRLPISQIVFLSLAHLSPLTPMIA
jgi:hypothetical protein